MRLLKVKINFIIHSARQRNSSLVYFPAVQYSTVQCIVL